MSVNMNRSCFLTNLLAFLSLHGPSLYATVNTSQLYTYLESDGANNFNFTDDSCVKVNLDSTFQYQKFSYKEVFINSNGNLAFIEGVTNTWIGNTECHSTLSAPLIMVFWSDVNPRNNGKITYLLTQQHSLLEKLSLDVFQAYPRQGASLLWALVVTWSRVNFYSADTENEKALENTFKVVLTSDGSRSFVLFLYHKIQWPEPSYSKPATVGFLDNCGKFIYKMAGSCSYNVNYRVLQESNVNSPGKWIFRVDAATLISPEGSNEYRINVQCQNGYSLYSSEKGKVSGDLKCRRSL